MDCTVCNVRSSISYCNECQTLLCEECAAVCDECRKRMCPMHTHETRHGRALCLTCFTDYTEHRRRREAESEGVDLGPPAVERPRMTRSSESLRPWIASLYMSLLGAAGIGLLLFVPSLRHIDFGAGKGIPTAYIVMILPMLAIAWAVLGLFTRWTSDPKALNFVGFSIAVATIALTFLTVRPQSANFNLDFSATSATKETQRANETPEQLKGWRKDMLDRYEGENAPKGTPRQAIELEEVVPPPR